MTHIEKLFQRLAQFAELAQFDIDTIGTVEIQPPHADGGNLWIVTCGFVTAHGADLGEALNAAIEEAKDKTEELSRLAKQKT